MKSTLVLICSLLALSPSAFAAQSGSNVKLDKRSHLKLLSAGKQYLTPDLSRQPICGLSLVFPETRRLPDPRRTYRTEAVAPFDEVGDIRTFNAIDFSTDERKFKKVVARAETKGEHAYFYVDTTQSFDRKKLEELFTLFETKIYPTTTGIFWDEPRPGIDGDPRITILFLPINESPTTVGDISGYFWPGNQFPKSQVKDSNEREMLYIDIARLNRFGVRDAASIIAHEFQHLIHWNHDRDEEVWVNEGLSEYASFANGFGIPEDLMLFLTDTDVSLMSWANRPRDYARVFLWIAYLVDHFGGDQFARDLVAEPADGLAGLAHQLDRREPGLTVEQVFGDWAVANFLDDPTFGAGKYGYTSFELPALVPTVTFGFLPVAERFADVRAYASDYLLFSGGKNLVVTLRGPVEPGGFFAKAVKLKNGGVPEIIDVEFNDTGEVILPFLDFGINFDQLLLLPYLLVDPDVQTSATYEFAAEGTGGPAAFADTLQYHDNESRTIIALGLPSPLVNSEHFDAYAVRLTPVVDGILTGADFAVWRTTGRGGTVRFFVYDDSPDTSDAPGAKIDSVDVENVHGTVGNITWNHVDFSAGGTVLQAGHDFHLGWELVNAAFGDTVFAILDTAKVPTNRSSVFVRERQRWAHFVKGFNFFLRAIVSVPADPSVPKITAGLVQNPVFSEVADVFVVGQKSLNPVSVEGTFALGDSVYTLAFHAIDDSNKVFVDDRFRLFASGQAQLVVSARNRFGTIMGTDSLLLTVSLVDGEAGGEIKTPDRKLTLHLPAGAIEKRVYLTASEFTEPVIFLRREPPVFEGSKPTEQLYSIGPPGLTFEQPAQLTFAYDENSEAMLAENDLAIAFLDGSRWVLLGGELYRQNKTISVLVNRTGSYALVIKSSGSASEVAEVPERFYLQQNYPNPFNPRTSIRFGLPKTTHTTVRIINFKGQVISVLLDRVVEAGEHTVEWDGTDDRKVPVASGVYLYQLKADKFVETKKLVLVK